MKKVIYILFLLLISLTAIAQETPPPGLKAINAQFYIHLPDSTIWQQKGSPYGWHQVPKQKNIKNYVDSLFAEANNITASNWVTKTGNNLALGGSLSSNLSLDLAAFNMTISEPTFGSYLSFERGSAIWQGGDNTVGNGQLNMSNSQTQLSFQKIAGGAIFRAVQMSPTAMIFANEDGKAATYQGNTDISAAHSIPDKENVNTLISALLTSSNTFSGVNNFTNRVNFADGGSWQNDGVRTLALARANNNLPLNMYVSSGSAAGYGMIISPGIDPLNANNSMFRVTNPLNMGLQGIRDSVLFTTNNGGNVHGTMTNIGYYQQSGGANDPMAFLYDKSTMSGVADYAFIRSDKSDGNLIKSTGTAGVLLGGDVTARSLIKAGGTSSQYLMADGSVSTGPSGGVSSFNTRTGSVVPIVGDYSSFYGSLSQQTTNTTNIAANITALTLKQDSSAITRLLLNGKLNQVAKGNGANPGLARLFMFFFDSLTDGAGTPQTTFRKTLLKIIRSYLGDGGPGYFAFDNAIAVDGGATWGFGGPLTPLAITDANGGKYSIDGRGLYTTTGPGSGCFINWNPASNWTNGRVFYLKQPGGGTFSYGTSDILSGSQPVLSTDSAAVSLGWIDIPIGAGTAGKTLQLNNITGKVVVFGTLFTQSTTGVLFADCAKGGRLMHDAALQDTTMLRRWFNVLKPTEVILNGGMNDRLTISAAQHFADNITFIAPIKRGNPLTHVTIIQSNEPSDATTTNFLLYTPQKISAALATGSSYYDERDRLGNYANAVSRGYMFDAIHPNGIANIIRAQALASALGFPENGNDPGPSAYPAGSSTINYKQTLTTKSFLSQAAGTPFTIATLGFVNGFPNIRVNLQITGVRNGTNFQVIKNITMASANGTVNNQASDVNSIIVNPVDINSSGGDFTISASIVSNKLVITVTPSGFLMNFVVSGDVTAPFNTTAGQLLFEN